MNQLATSIKGKHAEGHALKRTGKAKLARVKAVQSKAAKFDKPVIVHLLIFFVIGIVLGTAVFFPFYENTRYSTLKIIFSSFFVIGILLGLYHQKRALKKIDWVPSGKFLPRFILTLGISLLVCAGTILVLMVLPILLPSYASASSFAIACLLGSAFISISIPFLLHETFDYATEIESKSYKIWEFPQNYIEKQPTWNRERIVYSNINFQKHERDSTVTTIKVKLPKEAVLGELIYLFIKDYNENRSPDDPIHELFPEDGTIGWLFKSDNKGIGRIWKKKILLDTDLTIEENGIEEDGNIYLKRIRN